MQQSILLQNPSAENCSSFLQARPGLQMHGVTSELVVFPDQGHWIQKPNNIIAWYTTIARFLETHL